MNELFTDKPGKPGVPEIGTIKDGQVSLSWTPPEDDGGAPITNYVLEYKEENAFKWTKATEKEISDPKYEK